MKQNVIVTTRPQFFKELGSYNYCTVDEMIFMNKMACDTETTGLSPLVHDIFSIQLSTNTHNYLVDVESIDLPYLLNKLKILNPILVFHNSKFDLGFLAKYNYFPRRVRDTMLASQILHNGLVGTLHNFKEVMLRELKLEYDKSEQISIATTKLTKPETIEYCFQDVDKLLELEAALNKKIIKGGYTLAYKDHCRWIRAAAYMEQCGVPISTKAWLDKIKKDKEILVQKSKIIEDYIWEFLPQYREKQLDLFDDSHKVTVLLSSPSQMLPVFKSLGINTTDSEGKESTNEETIRKTKHPFVDLWLDYKEIAHDVSTYGENFLEHIHEERLYTRYKPILDTARISAGGKEIIQISPTYKKTVKFPNTLNIPANEKSRSPFQVREGNKLIVCDFQGQETTVGADITGDKAMIDNVIYNQDLHCAFSRVLNLELADLSDEEIIRDHKDKRNAAKAPRFCFQFGGTAFTLALNENIPIQEAKRIEEAYRALHSGVYAAGDKKFEEVLKCGYIESTKGFKLHLKNFEEFQRKTEWLRGLGRDFWNLYGIGKKEYQKYKEAKGSYKIQHIPAYNLYRDHAYDISQLAKKKSEIYKLCLNNPTQTTSAFQTKAAVNRIYEHIYKNNHFWLARIALAVHDEILVEVPEYLAEEYREVVETAMKEEGNKFLTNPLLFMNCEAKIVNNWWEGK